MSVYFVNYRPNAVSSQ